MLDYNRVFRATIIAAIAFAATLLSLALLQQLLVPILVWLAPSLEIGFYDLGFFGAYRTQDYISFGLKSPHASIVRWDDTCDHGYVFLDLSGPSPDHKGPLIIDARGNLIWTSDEYETTTNSKIQVYRGQEYLTFWSGRKAKTSGTGVYLMLDSEYNVFKKVDAVGEGLHGDLHEFKITQDETALMTVYTPVQADLTAMGMFRGKNGWIVENMFQEVDLESGELIFEWRASEHFRPEDSFMTNPFGGYFKSIPFDFFHINSVEKGADGNYLISSRHFHAIYLIDGKTGEVLWALGGDATNFIDLSHGAASDFSWQHDARWLSEEDGIISLFDNSYAWPHADGPYSQGRIIQVDRNNGTATLLHSYSSLQHARSSSQGSLQLLPTGHGEPHVFIGWGSSAAFSEHTSDGHLLCETHFAASSLFWWERVKSYRAFKALSWSAMPAAWDPVAKIYAGDLFVSWNGATGVAFWELQWQNPVGDASSASWASVDVLDKQLFEESFPLPPGTNSRTRFRVAALDKDRNTLRFSNETSLATGGISSFVLAGVSAVICIAAICAFWTFRRRGYGRLWTRYPQLVIDRSKYQQLWRG